MSLIFGLLLWIMFVFILPSSINTVTNTLIKTPLTTTKDHELSTHFVENVFLLIQKTKNMPEAEAQKIKAYYFERWKKNHYAIIEGFYNLEHSLLKVFRLLSKFSPVNCFVNSATDINGTGIEYETRYNEKLVPYFKNLNYNLENKIDFTFPESSLSSNISLEIILNTLLLFCYSLMLLFLSFYKFNTFDVR